ncbi:hypothetical protein RB598_008139 [Gaeumannomyces tritici]
MPSSRQAKDAAERQPRYIELDIRKSGRTVTVCLGRGKSNESPEMAKSSPASKPGMTRFEAASKAAQAWRSTSSSSVTSRSSRSSRTTTSSIRRALRFGSSPATDIPPNDASPSITASRKQNRGAPPLPATKLYDREADHERGRNLDLNSDTHDDSRTESCNGTLKSPAQYAPKPDTPVGGEKLSLRDRRRRSRSTNRQGKDDENGRSQKAMPTPAFMQQHQHPTGVGVAQSVPGVPSGILQQPVYYINQPQPANDSCAPQFYYAQHPGHHFTGPMVSPNYQPVQNAFALQAPFPTQAIPQPPPTPFTPAAWPPNTGLAPPSATSSGNGHALQIQVPQVVVYTSSNSPATQAVTPSCTHAPCPSPVTTSRSNSELYKPASSSVSRRDAHSGRSKASTESTFRTGRGGARMLAPLSRHYFCFGCGRVRSKRFHLQNPLRPDQNPDANYCANCRRQHAAEGRQQSQQRHAYPLQDDPDLVIPETSTIASGSCLSLGDGGDDGFRGDDGGGRYLAAGSYHTSTPTTVNSGAAGSSPATPAALQDTPKRGRSLDCRPSPHRLPCATPQTPSYSQLRQAQNDSRLKSENDSPYAMSEPPSSHDHHGSQYRPPSVESVIDSSLGLKKPSAGRQSPPSRRRRPRRVSSVEPILQTAPLPPRLRRAHRSPEPAHQSGRVENRDGGASVDTKPETATSRGSPSIRNHQGKREKRHHHPVPPARSPFDSTKQVRFDPHLDQWFSNQELSSSSLYGGDGELGESSELSGETKPRCSATDGYGSDDSARTVLNANNTSTRGFRGRVDSDQKDNPVCQEAHNGQDDHRDPFAIPPRPRKPQLFTVTTESEPPGDDTTASPAPPISPYATSAMPRPRCVSDWTMPTGWRSPTADAATSPKPPLESYMSPSIDAADVGADSSTKIRTPDGGVNGGGGGGGSSSSSSSSNHTGGHKPTSATAQQPHPRAAPPPPPPEILISAASTPDWQRRPHSTPAAAAAAAPIDRSRLSAPPPPPPRPASAASAPAGKLSFDFSSLGDGPTPRDRSDPFYAHSLSDWELEQRLDELRAGPAWFRAKEEGAGCCCCGGGGGGTDGGDDCYDEYGAYGCGMDNLYGGEGERLPPHEEYAAARLGEKIPAGCGPRLGSDGFFDGDAGYQSSLD